MEHASLAVLQHHLLTEEHAPLFVMEFERETRRLVAEEGRQDNATAARLRQLTTELENLYQNLLIGVASPALQTMIAVREAEKAQLTRRARKEAHGTPAMPMPTCLVLRERFSRKVAELRTSLDDETMRTEAAALLSTLIESVTIYPDEADGPEAEVVAKVANLLGWAINDNAARKGGVSSSMAVVAGTCGQLGLLTRSWWPSA
ncbi:hypothetical protein J2Y58_003656 [Sphingomonas sp. BE138]|uniref:hypothetical protein n=1 Tax=Sphingomonas sp. BE138 TaxID=2817845 RepID=UPI00285B94C0|nr:hypothetical protein [Sphingomonas sp. BE138]MDR6790276.1 hypothetical protein [Sphingomonas sp. BE138]